MKITPEMIIGHEDMRKFLMGFAYKEPTPPPKRKERSMIEDFKEWEKEQETSNEAVAAYVKDRFKAEIGYYNICMFKELVSLNNRIERLEKGEEDDDS